MHFPFMDTIAGYVTSYDRDANRFDLEAASGERFTVSLVGDVSAELLRNDAVSGRGLDHRRGFLPADRHRQLTARMEAAAARRFGEIGR